MPPPPVRIANRIEIAVSVVFLVGLTIYLLYGITTRWPACELPEDSNSAAVANNNTQTNANANQNTNANRNANANQNANVNQNVNANTNPAAGAATPTPASQPPSVPVMSATEPASGSIKGGKTVTIRGSGLARDDVIRFDEKEAPPVGGGGGESLTVKTPSHEEGRVDVTLYRGGTLMSRLAGGYTYVCPAPSGTSLFYMLIMAGALGGCIHAMRSLWWYAGNGELKAPWLPMYFLLPFIGAAMAMIFSLLIVAGIVDNTTGRSTSLFIIAIAGLVGMFSQQAALKLTDIANAFFTKPGPGKDSKPQESQSVGERGTGTGGVVPVINPNSGPTAGGTLVAISDTGFTDVKSVTFDATPATEVKFDKATSTITAVTPAHAQGKVVVVVMNQADVAVVLSYTYAAPAAGSGGQTATTP
ncbi:MAG: IPT/TIG domain-containing protein [Pyrinomonadaceae bacterium]